MLLEDWLACISLRQAVFMLLLLAMYWGVFGITKMMWWLGEGNRVICWFSTAKHEAESLRSTEAKENITLPLYLNMCLIVAYFWYFSCIDSSNIYNVVDHVKRKEKCSTKYLLVLMCLRWTLSHIFSVCKKSKTEINLTRSEQRRESVDVRVVCCLFLHP